jgi:fructose-bisphosphate aldolase class I
MSGVSLIDTAPTLVCGGKGLLAMDESIATCDRRFAGAGIPQTEAARRTYREMIVTTPGLGDSISGAILFDETMRQSTLDGRTFVSVLADAGVIPGVKVDTGAKALAGHPGERVTEGLDDLRKRLADYASMGARFAKWRAVISMGASVADALPSRACVAANGHALARYAALCQEAGLVPIVEPEVLMTGDHGLEHCLEVTQETLRIVFGELEAQGVALEAMILKPNMVLAGLGCPRQEPPEAVAAATLQCLLRSAPAAVPGIAFLSGGQSAELASTRLNAINLLAASPEVRAPWSLVFSFGRALQQGALALWGGKDSGIDAAQAALAHRASCNGAAIRGRYGVQMERA